MAAPLDPVCLFRVLADHGVEYVLIGGLAAVLHGSTAMTNDADIFPDPDPENLARVAESLRDLDARIRSVDDPEGLRFDPHPSLLAAMKMLNLTTRCGNLDIAFEPAAMGGFTDLVKASVEMEIEELTIRVADLAAIIASKTAADRAKDRAVLPILHALREEIERSRRKD